MCINISPLISLAHQYVVVPISVLGTKGAQLITELFKQLKDGLCQAFKSLKSYLWKVPINQGAPNQETRNIPAPILQIISASTTTSVPLSSRESGPFTGQLIEASAVLPFLPFELPIEVLTKHLLPHCTATDLHHVLLTNKQYLSLFKDANVLSHLLSELNAVDRTKLMSVVGPYLTDIEIGGNTWTQEQFSELIQNCPNLTGIRFVKCIQITDHTIKALAQACPHVTSIYLNECEEITDDIIKALAQAYPNLTKFQLDDTNLVSDTGITALALGCPNLASIELDAFGFNITDTAIEVIAKHCRSLTHIAIGTLVVMPETIKAFAESGKNLRSIVFHLFVGLTHEDIKLLDQFFPNLIELDIRIRDETEDQVDRACQTVATSFPQLTSLQLTCPKMTDKNIQALTQGRRNLAKLNLRAYGNGGVTGEAIQFVSQNCPNLTDFSCDSVNVTGQAIEAMVQKMPNLTRLCLHSPKITEDSVKAVARNCPNLVSLDLNDGGTNKITDNAIKAIADHCRNLKELYLGARAITGGAIHYLAQHCHQIEWLNVANRSNLTEEDWKHFPGKFKKLRHLGIGELSSTLISIYPHLHLFDYYRRGWTL